MSPEDFLKLIYSSKMIVGNSSVGIRECSYLGVPAVNIGSRQSGREYSDNVVNVNYDIKKKLKLQLKVYGILMKKRALICMDIQELVIKLLNYFRLLN